MKILFVILLSLALSGCLTTGTYQQQSKGESWGDLFGRDISYVGPKLNITFPETFLSDLAEFQVIRKGGSYAGVQLKKTTYYFWQRKFYRVILRAKGYKSWLTWKNKFFDTYGRRSNYFRGGGEYWHGWGFRNSIMGIDYDKDSDEVMLIIYCPDIEFEIEESEKK